MKNFDLIEKYFTNDLTPEEQLLFNKQLQKNKDFEKEFRFQKDLKQAIVSNQRDELKSTLQSFESEIQKKSGYQSIPKKWLIAASVILLLGLGSILIKTAYFPSPERLFVQNFEPYRNIIQPVARGENINTIESSAFVAYENKNYHKAINLFNSVEDPDTTYILFYKAMCQLSINNAAEAIKLLTPIATSAKDKDQDKNFKELSNWYLALAYLKNNEEAKAISQFSLVAYHPSHTFKKEEAKSILDALK